MALKEAAAASTPERPPAKLPKVQRQDAWWVQPVATAVVLIIFGVYVTWRAFENAYPNYQNYISPLYSPHIPLHLSIGTWAISPAVYILPIPLLFRATCYYYRKAYYRAFFWDPPACGVSEPFTRKGYNGERAFPLILQNIHRYMFYLAAIVVIVLWWDTILAFDFNGKFGMGVGSLIFLANVVLLSLYTFSCHSWRHLTGGCLNCYSCSSGAKTRHGIWEKVTHLNENHALWAWLSLFSVWITDLYVRCLAIGTIHDVRFF